MRADQAIHMLSPRANGDLHPLAATQTAARRTLASTAAVRGQGTHPHGEVPNSTICQARFQTSIDSRILQG
jgi:hypothetical protein